MDAETRQDLEEHRMSQTELAQRILNTVQIVKGMSGYKDKETMAFLWLDPQLHDIVEFARELKKQGN